MFAPKVMVDKGLYVYQSVLPVNAVVGLYPLRLENINKLSPVKNKRTEEIPLSPNSSAGMLYPKRKLLKLK